MDVTCPHCAMAMTEDEAAAGTCPGCRKPLRQAGWPHAKTRLDPQDAASKLSVDHRVSSALQRRRAGPSRRVGRSFARSLAYGTVATSLLPGPIFLLALRESFAPRLLAEAATDRCVYALVASGITVIAGVMASLKAAEDDRTTRQIASFGVVLAAFNIVIAIMLFGNAMG